MSQRYIHAIGMDTTPWPTVKRSHTLRFGCISFSPNLTQIAEIKAAPRFELGIKDLQSFLRSNALNNQSTTGFFTETP